MKSLKEKGREIPIIDELDVVVVGGGPAGVAAAVTASEQGMKTLIIEKNGFFGGANVSGNSGTIGGLYSSTEEGELEQIVFGFAGRFADKLREKGGLIGPVRFGHTALAPHDPFVWKETADQFIKNANVKVLFHTYFVDVIMEENKIVGIIIENKDGRSAIMGKIFIDASGDGDVAARAGAPYVYGKDGFIQAMTMTFRMGNVDWNKASKYSLEDIWKKVSEAEKTGQYNLPRKHPFIFPTPKQDQALMNSTAIIAPDDRVLYPTKADDLTFAEIAGREQIREYERFAKDYLEGFEDAYIFDNGNEIGIRQSRTIVGEYTLKNEDVVNAKKFDTAIARSAWPIEMHGGSKGVKVVNLDDDYYEIPFEVMLPKDIEGVMTVGRCISAEHEALASCRVVAQCFEEGLAAGIAAAMCVKENIEPRQVDIQKVRETMIANGSVL
ncbi:FAD-dependent oxidoreductase [Wukongibacter baidiensis]|uniref:FAD-dependent oxidoreductase n=1 Tax=Wukongibacter baidiensis TaxID=1723361 RepID=UPI003D7F3B89